MTEKREVKDGPGGILEVRTGGSPKAETVDGTEVKPGDVLVIAGSIGQLGARALLEARKEELSTWFSPEYMEQALLNSEKQLGGVLDVLKGCEESFGISGVQAVGEGGIFRAIWELSGEYGVGVSFSLHCIPIWQWVIEVCERCGVNPYRLWCGNCLLLAAQRGWQLAQALKGMGIEAEVIGAVEGGIARKIVHRDETGYLERPREDELYRLLGKDTATQMMENVIGE